MTIETPTRGRPRMRPEDVEHGTQRGYAWHARTGVPVCTPCLDAHAEDCAERRAARANNSPLARSLADARTRVGLTKEEVADRLGWTSPYSIEWIENGSRQVSLQALEEWVALLGCRIEIVPADGDREAAPARLSPAPAVQDTTEANDGR